MTPGIRPESALTPLPEATEFVWAELTESYDESLDEDREGATVRVLIEKKDGTYTTTEREIAHCFHWVCDPPVLDECTRVLIRLKGAHSPCHRIWMWECQ